MKKIAALFCLAVLAVPVLAVGTHLKRDRPLSISQGQPVNLGEFLVTGDITVFAFTSEYCVPCRHYDDLLYLLHSRLTRVAVVKVDINRPEIHQIDWRSPVAAEYDIHELPWFKIYGPEGKVLAEGDAARSLVDSWIERANRAEGNP